MFSLLYHCNLWTVERTINNNIFTVQLFSTFMCVSGNIYVHVPLWVSLIRGWAHTALSYSQTTCWTNLKIDLLSSLLLYSPFLYSTCLGCKDTRLQLIQLLRRQAFMYLTDPTKTLNVSFRVCNENAFYSVYTISGSMKREHRTCSET